MAGFKRHPHPDELDTDEENDESIDPELRLRTVRTAASTIAESIRTEQRMQRRRSKIKSLKFFRNRAHEKRRADDSVAEDSISSSIAPAPTITGSRRNVYVNMPLSPSDCDTHGEPIARYVRNKVRTTKYTILSFIPKNLYEQFRRVANLYFLVLVVIQVFPVFGAAGAQISMLPLVFILTVTAIKDGIEDYRRAILDDQVNNSAATKLGDWRNVNQPRDSRSWLQRLLRVNAPGTVSKGVRKLRSKEAGSWGRIVLQKVGEPSDVLSDSERTAHGPDESVITLGGGSGLTPMSKLEDASDYSVSYPPLPSTNTTLTRIGGDEAPSRLRSGSLFSHRTAASSRKSMGVVDWNRRVPGTAKWERTLWKKLEVGDVVLLRENDQVPADIVVLSTSDPDGLCYLETKNLDGETNLKQRKSLKATSSLQSEEDVEHACFVLDSEPPHANLYLYNGVLRYRNIDSNEEKTEPVTINELLLRGCTVRNTPWIVGLVLFTGADTKIMLNGGNTPSKRSKIEKETNFNVVMNFVALILLCLATAIANGVFDGMTGTSKDFFEQNSDPTNSPAINAIVTFASCLILFQNIVPISLYISIEIVKTIQAYFISQDVDMFYAPFDTACVPKTWNISDDLGQIEYIFSDKTGTLTQNVMEFQKCSVRGVKYGEGITEAQRGAAKRAGVKDALDPVEQAELLASLKAEMQRNMSEAYQNRWQQPDKLTLISPQLVHDLSNRRSPQRDYLIDFFRALAICHTVLADKPDPQMRPFYLEYKAESPDEAALVSAARDVGFPFVGKTNGYMEIEVMGRVERYALLRVLEFNSTRKRMSVIVRNPEGRLVLYTKGADSVIYARLAADHDPELKAKTTKDMEDFANGGLRTLCIASRFLSEEEYSSWSQVYDVAASAVTNRDEQLEQACEQIEHSLHILGATALEDKLQEGVPEAIEMLHKAGIKLWILTGDKVQTAIEIGYSCNLLKQDMDVMIISAASPDEARSKIEAGLNKLASVFGPPTWSPKTRGFVLGAQASFAVVIDGDTLRFALSPDLKPLFLNLATQCETVVCCRVSPAQKAQTVKLVKDGRNAMTLSIGDGANDVAMIQEANVGCGLFGLEGSQAAMSADYAFGQFRFLTKLLIVHGRWSYLRVADMHGNFFYKNVVWTFASFWYLFYNSFDATYLYEYTFILLYNVVFTSLPVIAMGAFDQDINAKAAVAFPQLYLRGIRGLEYTRTKFWLYMADGLYQSVVVYFIPYFAWSLGPAISWNGKGIDSLADFGTTVAVAAILAVNTYVGMNTHYWTVITWIVVVGSTLVMIIWISIYSAFNSVDFNDEVVVLYGEITFWATVLVSTVLALGPRYVTKFVQVAYFPLDRDLVREMWVKGDLKKQLGIKSRYAHKNKSDRDVENDPIYRPDHERSISELSQQPGGYEPTLTHSPGEGDNSEAVKHTEYMATIQEWRDDESFVDHSKASYVVGGDPDDSQLTAVGAIPSFPPISPAPSYYSASDIPVPSPHPSSSPQKPFFGHDRTPSGSGTRELTVPSESTYRTNVLQPLQRSTPEPDSYELQIRPPPSSFPATMRANSPFNRGGSRASEASQYATASERWDESEDDHSTINHGRRDSNFSAGPHAI